MCMHPEQYGCSQGVEREVYLMHSNELHPRGKLSQDDVKTLLFTAIISLLTKTFRGGRQTGRE